MIGALVVLLAVAGAPDAPAPLALPVVADAPACPPPKTFPPRYPIDMLRQGKSGTAIVEARFDDCGRVLEVRLAKSSGQGQLNTAAMNAVSGFVLSAEQRAKAVDGWTALPIRFGGVRTVDVREIPWPRSHGRPHYRLDEHPVEFDTIDDFRASRTEDNDVPTRQPFESTRDAAGNRISTSLHADRTAPGVFWFTYMVQSMPSRDQTLPLPANEATAIARLRLVQEDGEPVVRVATLCDVPAEACARFEAMLLQGLPFARPR